MRILLISLFALLIALPATAATLQEDVARLAHEWAVLKYQTPDKDAQIKGLQKLADEAKIVADNNPGTADAIVWRSAIISTKANLVGGLGALDDVTLARDLALEALKIKPSAVDGYAYTILGTIYHKVPGWPIAFGDNKKAEKYFSKAMEISPDGMDSNFYYAEYLEDRGQDDKARHALEKALAAPDRPDMKLADEGRRAQIKGMLADKK